MSTNTTGNYPLVYREEPTIRLAVVYNPFDLSDIAVHQLVYNQDHTLADYLQGLPEEVTWLVGYNGQAIERADWATVKPSAFSNISLVRVPEGGKAGKSILRIAAMIAVVVAAAVIGPVIGAAMPGLAGFGTAAAWTAAASTGIAMAGSMLVNAMIGTGVAEQDHSSSTYGIDGPKNTAREGVPVPRVYGLHRVGGNITDCFTKNVGNDQYLYMRTAVNDGEVEDITDLEINNQPVEFYNANDTTVEVRIHKGDDDQEVNDWFNEAIRMEPRQTKLGKAYTQVRTQSQVDKVRLDLLFPYGLYFAKSDGRHQTQTVGFAIGYRKVDEHGNPQGGWDNLPLDGAEGYTTAYFITDSTDQPKRITYQSAQLPRGYYEIRMNRDKDSETGTSSFTECYLQDVGEIDVSPVKLNGVATISIKAKVSSQISGVPQITALLKGSKVNVYDDDGVVIEKRWSDNPSHVATDILCNPIRGAGYKTSRIVWATANEFADFCEANNLKFNGVYDTIRTTWDSLVMATKVGRGTPYPRGTKLAFVWDAPSEPVMLFGPGNILKGSFKKSWVSLTDRANEIQMQFYDQADGNRQKTVRLTDNIAVGRGKVLKPATVDGFGITISDQAVAAAEYAARTNSYIRQSIELDAPLESIGINVGEVALIQHDTVNFGDGAGGRTKSGSTNTSVVLDKPVTMEGGDYRLLVMHSAVKVATVTVTSVNGSKVTVSGASNFGKVSRIRQGGVDREIMRVVEGSATYLTVDGEGIHTGSAELWDTDVTEEATVASATLSEDGYHSTLTLSSPLLQAPPAYTNYLFGQAQSVKLPFRLKKVKGKGVEKRTLSFVQYDARVYEAGGWGQVEIKPVQSKIGQVRSLAARFGAANPNQERIPVTIDWLRPASGIYGGADVYYCLNPVEGEDRKYDILSSVQNVTSVVRDFSRGDAISFKVVAFDKIGNRARLSEAPTFDLALDGYTISLDPPTDLILDEPVWKTDATVTAHWTKPESVDPDGYRVETRVVDQTTYDLLSDDTEEWPDEITGPEGWKVIAKTPGTSIDIPRLSMGLYLVRVRAEKGFAASPWLSTKLTLEAPAIPVKVTGLRLGQGAPDVPSDSFVGQDATWTWDDIVTQAATYEYEGLTIYWQDYRVRIIDPVNDEVVRTEYTTSPSYAYTISKNQEDGKAHSRGPRRTFKIEVTIRGKLGQLSQHATMVATNPAPAMPTGLVSFEDLNFLVVSWDACKEPDYAGTAVYVGTAPNFFPNDGNRHNDAPTNMARIPIAEEGDYYVRIGHYDSFSRDPENISDVYGAYVPAAVIDDLKEASKLGKELGDKILSYEDEIEMAQVAFLELNLQSVARQVQDAALDDLRQKDIGTAVENLTNDRIEGETALVDTVSLIGAKSGDGLSFILNRNSLKVSEEESLLDHLEAYESSTGENFAQVTREIQTVTTKAEATASVIDLIGAKTEDGQGFILNAGKVKVTKDGVTANLDQTIQAATDKAIAQADKHIETAAGPNSALARNVDNLGVQVNGNGTPFSGLVGAIQRTNDVVAENDRVTARSLNTLSVQVNGDGTPGSGIVGTIKHNEEIQADKNSFFGSSLNLLGGRSPDGASWVMNTSTVKTGNGQNIADYIAGVASHYASDAADAALKDAKAYAGQQFTTDGAPGQLLAQQLGSLGLIINGGPGNPNGMRGDISDLRRVTLGPNGLEAKATLDLDVNDHIVGWSIKNNGKVGSMEIAVDRFALVDASTRVSPFVMIGGKLYLGDVTVQKLQVGSASKFYPYYQYNSLRAINQSWTDIADFNYIGGGYTATFNVSAGWTPDAPKAVTTGMVMQLIVNGNTVAARDYTYDNSHNDEAFMIGASYLYNGANRIQVQAYYYDGPPPHTIGCRVLVDEKFA